MYTNEDIASVQKVFEIIRESNTDNYFELITELENNHEELLPYAVGEFAITINEYMHAYRVTNVPEILQKREQARAKWVREYTTKFGHFPTSSEVPKF